MKPLISIVIPCYNHGEYLPDALDSVNYLIEDGVAEVIIVNDGSNQQKTLSTLNKVSAKYKVVNQINMGLATARNNGIRLASGKYILPLDCDNIVEQGFVDVALKKLESDPLYDIVYSDSYHFGEADHYYHVGPFSPVKLINDNYIDACAVYKKQVWEELEGYDAKMPVMGHEDWDFWIRAFMIGKKFCYVGKVGFRYRVRSDSMLRVVTLSNLEKNRQHIYKKHNLDLFESIHRNYSSDSYKAKYLDLLGYLKRNRFKSILKVIFGLRFNQ